MTSHRQRRVADYIQEQLAELFLREARDPRLGQLTITGVDVSPDLRQAKIFFSVLGDEALVREVQQALDHAAGYLRRELASRLQLRFAPSLTFRHDSSLVTGSRIEELLNQIELEGDQE